MHDHLMTAKARRELQRLRAKKDSEIDYSDIPRLSAASLKKAKWGGWRIGAGRKPKGLTSLHITISKSAKTRLLSMSQRTGESFGEIVGNLILGAPKEPFQKAKK